MSATPAITTNDPAELVGRWVSDSKGEAFEVTDTTADNECIIVSNGGLDEFQLTLADMLVIEDDTEDRGIIEADDRATCHTCKTWATPSHVASASHIAGGAR